MLDMKCLCLPVAKKTSMPTGRHDGAIHDCIASLALTSNEPIRVNGTINKDIVMVMISMHVWMRNIMTEQLNVSGKLYGK